MGFSVEYSIPKIFDSYSPNHNTDAWWNKACSLYVCRLTPAAIKIPTTQYNKVDARPLL